jgi:hypothetical protein
MSGTNARTARLYLANAAEFLAGAEDIAARGEREDFPWPPFFSCVGNALELSLKAYILQRGGTEDQCRATIRHDLGKAVAAALRRGLAKPEPEVMKLIMVVGPYHRGNKFRERAPVDIGELPDLAHALAALRRMLEHVRELPPA